jgi:hypothetical protein
MIREVKNDDIPGIRALIKAEPGFWPKSWRADVLERGLQAAAAHPALHPHVGQTEKAELDVAGFMNH